MSEGEAQMQAAINPLGERDARYLDVFESQHGTIYQVIYIDDQVVLLRDKATQNGQHIHRIEQRATFEELLEAGAFTLRPHSSLNLISAKKADWSAVNTVGDMTSSNLHDAGYETPADIAVADDSDLLAVDGVGKRGLKNLREYTQ